MYMGLHTTVWQDNSYLIIHIHTHSLNIFKAVNYEMPVISLFIRNIESYNNMYIFTDHVYFIMGKLIKCMTNHILCIVK